MLIRIVHSSSDARAQAHNNAVKRSHRMMSITATAAGSSSTAATLLMLRYCSEKT